MNFMLSLTVLPLTTFLFIFTYFRIGPMVYNFIYSPGTPPQEMRFILTRLSLALILFGLIKIYILWENRLDRIYLISHGIATLWLFECAFVIWKMVP